jgi:hypothetical protein
MSSESTILRNNISHIWQFVKLMYRNLLIRR